MTDFKSKPLFGGAITADLPSTFQDVSAIRQVPDNQEVYLDSQGFSSIVFDILERVEKPTDAEAVRYHLEDILESDGDGGGEGMKVWGDVKSVELGKMPNTKAYTLLATSPPGAKQLGRANEPDFVAILLLVVRLEAQGTDVVIAMNVPHLPGEYEKEGLDFAGGKIGRLLEVGEKVRERVVGTFEVRDWGLFGE